MRVVFVDVMCCFFSFSFVYGLVFIMNFMARPVDQDHFLFGCDCVFIVGMGLRFEIKIMV